MTLNLNQFYISAFGDNLELVFEDTPPIQLSQTKMIKLASYPP